MAFDFSVIKANPFKFLFWAAFAVTLFVFPLISSDYGTTFDEKVHNGHGKMLLEYFTGRSDLAKKSPFTEDGKLKPIPPEDREDFSDLNFFGGTFDLIVAFTQKYLHFTGEFEQRHFINSLFGVLAILFTGLVAMMIAGWRAGFIAFCMLALSPRFVAHSMNNPKDVPFAALFILSVFFIIRFVRELPKPKISTMILLAFAIGLSISIRVAGIMLIPFLLLFSSGKHILAFFTKLIEKEDLVKLFRSTGIALLVSITGYFITALFWPYDRTNPLGVPLKVLSEVSKLAIFNSHDLFMSRWWNPDEMPWYWMPWWTLIGTPLFISAGLITSKFMFIRKISGSDPVSRKAALMLLIVFTLPVAFVIFNHSYIFHDGRHLMFVIPPLVAFCALSWENLFRLNIPRIGKIILSVLLICFSIQPLYWMIKNHPNETTYFTPLIGGVDGAWKKYETDYYGNVMRQGVDWIQKNSKPSAGKQVRIRAPYGMKSCSDYWVYKKPGYVFVWADENSADWDYTLLMTSAAKLDSTILYEWPPIGTVYEVKADQTPLLAVYKNFRNDDPELLFRESSKKAEIDPSPQKYFRLGMLYYRARRFADAIEPFHKAVEKDSSFADAWNNLGACYNITQKYDKAIDAFRHVLTLNPDYALARNNLADATSKMNAALGNKVNPVTFNDTYYVNKSLEFYNKKEYRSCIDLCKEALIINPRNATAYNNMCASYNALQNYSDAARACQKALEINPNFDLARNNLNFAKSKIGK